MPEPMPPERLAEIRSREQAATPGPWLSETSLTTDDLVHLAVKTAEPMPEHPWSPRFVAWITGLLLPYVRPSERPTSTWCNACHHRCYRGRTVAVDIREDSQTKADASFIAFARKDVPDLLAEVNRLTADVDFRKQQVAELTDQRDALANEVNDANRAIQSGYRRRMEVEAERDRALQSLASCQEERSAFRRQRDEAREALAVLTNRMSEAST